MTSQQLTLAGIGELPSAPSVVLRLHKLMQDDDVGSREIARVVETDPSLVARILKLVNSPFYGYSRRIASIDEAIAILGSNSVQQLVLATAVFNTLGGSEPGAFDIQGFWWHCVGTGTCAKRLLQHSDRDAQNEAVTCGLLHDVGHLIFARMAPSRFEGLYVAKNSAISAEDEKEQFGFRHEQIGALLAESWNFPMSIAAAIAYHHSPEQAPEEYQQLVCAVHMGDILARVLGIGASATGFVTEFWPPAFELLNLDEPSLVRAVEHILREVEDLHNTLSL